MSVHLFGPSGTGWKVTVDQANRQVTVLMPSGRERQFHVEEGSASDERIAELVILKITSEVHRKLAP